MFFFFVNTISNKVSIPLGLTPQIHIRNLYDVNINYKLLKLLLEMQEDISFVGI